MIENIPEESQDKTNFPYYSQTLYNIYIILRAPFEKGACRKTLIYILIEGYGDNT